MIALQKPQQLWRAFVCLQIKRQKRNDTTQQHTTCESQVSAVAQRVHLPPKQQQLLRKQQQ